MNNNQKNNYGEQSTEQIQEFVNKNIGKVAGIFHEVASEYVHLDVIIIEPSENQPNYMLITSGMSDKPMNFPFQVNSDTEQHLELIMTLPGDWKLDLKNEKYYWPIRVLKTLARFPHQYNTYLGYGHTMQNGDYEPYTEGTKLCGSILVPVLGGYDDDEPKEKALKIRDNKIIHFYSVLPLYKNEVEFSLEHGHQEFFQKLIENDFSLEININREPYKL